MDQPLITAIDNYFKLKQKYEKQINDYISKIRKNESLTKKEKQSLFKQFQPKCVNCKKTGGSLFTNKDRVLKVVCGSAEPCKLYIEINEGKYANVISLEENYTKNVDAIKTKIIMTKLDFLFGYVQDETVAFDNFDKLRKNLGNYMQAQLLVQKNYDDVAHNPEKKEAIDTAQRKLYNIIDDLKNIYKLYQDNPRSVYITDMVEKYINIIQPLADKIRNMKYVRTVIETDNTNDRLDNTFTLVEKEYTLSQLEQEVYGDVKSGIVKNVL
jgi:hypothetical protein